MIKKLHIDIETRSSVDIKKSGLYKYAQSPDFKILLFAYKCDDEEVKIIDLESGEKIPGEIIGALADRNIIKYAFNAAFEWYCLKSAGYMVDLKSFRCVQAHALYTGYSGSLEKVGNEIGLSEDKKKLSIGKALIKYFCVPNKYGLFNRKDDAIEKWELFKSYCIGDVTTEYEIHKRLKYFPMPDNEIQQWIYDVYMNARGVRIDTELVENAIYIDDLNNKALIKEAKTITGLDNPNSNAQIINWLNANNVETDNIRKDTVKDLISVSNGDILNFLQLRQQLSKTSVKKYVAMANAVCSDERVRGISQYYGANQTGRWAGRIVQLQNLPRNNINTLGIAREWVKKGNYEAIKMAYGNVPDTLSQLIRTAFIPSDGLHLVVADFSAIEARVIAWLAGETWVNEVFKTHGKIYEATASQMFKVPIDLIKKGNKEYDLRQKGKVATLALGYQGGVNALIAMNALKMGIDEKELPDIVSKWREANPNIVKLWYEVEEKAIKAVEKGTIECIRGLTIRLESDWIYGLNYLTIELPSGRKLYYQEPKIIEGKFGKPMLAYVNAGTIKDTYGGKLTENIVQAIARDCLAVTIERITEAGLNIVFHVHDEVIVDAPLNIKSEYICSIMSESIPWAKGLVLKAAGFECDYYIKD